MTPIGLLPSGYTCMLYRITFVLFDVKCELTIVELSVVMDSEFASESANFSRVRPNPNPRIFGGRK